jgi:hypothetical protein
MANTVKLKKSSVLGKIPQSADLDYGELALNYADGKLYFKDSSNVIQLFGASSATDTLTNQAVNNSTINNTSIGATTPSTGAFTSLSATGNITAGQNLVSNFSSGDEGGEITLNKPATNTTISTSVTIDVWQNKLRIFESGGANRGAFIDLSAAIGGVGSNLLTAGAQGASLPSQTGNAGKYLTTDGSNLSWAAVAGSGGFPVVDAGLITESINMSAMVDAGTIA